MRIGRRLLLHGADLHRRSVRAQQQAIAQRLAAAGWRLQRVLRVAGRMVRRKVQRLEVVVVGLDFRADADGVAHVLEDAHDFVHGADQRVLRAEAGRMPGSVISMASACGEAARLAGRLRVFLQSAA